MRMNMNDNLRATVMRRIKALLSKTIENGASEAEAMGAAAKAREMMDEYQITQTEAELETDGVIQETVVRRRSGRMQIENWLVLPIATYCDCKVWRNGGKERVFMGLTGDVEFATWLLDSLRSFIENETTRYLLTAPHIWSLEKAFMVGCANRIVERLTLLNAERTPRITAMSDGRSLVVVKAAIVERAFAALGFKLGKARRAGRVTINDINAYRQGMAAGERASFSRDLIGSK